MKTISVFSLMTVLLLTGVVAATPITFQDPFPGTQWPTPGYDVIGRLDLFDIEAVRVDVVGSTLTVDVYTNYQNAAFSPYSYIGLNLAIGDLFFTRGDEFVYAIPLSSAGHHGLTQGELYSGLTTQTARQALGNPGVIYRPEFVVWAIAGTKVGDGSVLVEPWGNGTTHAKYHATVTTTIPEEFQTFIESGGWGVSLANATCANDFVEGAVPEPLTLLLMGPGLLGLGALRWRKRC